MKRWEALADGICDAAIAIVLEGRRPPKQQSKDWIDRQRRKVDAGVTELASELGEKTWCNGEGYTLADIATGCALGYLKFREAAIDYAHDFANLKKLADRLAKLVPNDPPLATNGSSAYSGWWSYVQKDLRALLGRPVSGPYQTRSCGGGDVTK